MSDDAQYWKDEYRQLVAEQEAAHAAADALQRDLRAMLRAALSACMGFDKAIDEEVEVLQIRLDRAQSTADLSTLKPVILDIAQAISRLQKESQRTASFSLGQLADTRDRFVDLLRRQPLLAEALAQSDIVTAASDDVGADFEQLAGLVVATCERLTRNLGQAEQFLAEVRESLMQLERWASESSANSEGQLAASDSLQQQVKSDVDTLDSEIRDNDDLDAVKALLRERMIAIADRITEYRNQEGERIETIRAQNAALSEELHRMREQSAALDAQLKEQRSLLLLDTLTQVHSRFAYDQHMSAALAGFARDAQPFAYTLWDIDHFKNINDRFGHTAGDDILRQVAAHLRRYTRETDFVARIGGEEFAILLPNTTAEKATVIADKLRAVVAAASFSHGDETLTVTLSCGIAQVSADDTAASLYDRADKALYAAKNSGRNRCIAA